MIRLEALADAIARLNKYEDPGSVAYRLRNPAMLRSFSLKHAADEDGFRIFDRNVNGYQAAINDLSVKVSGHSRSKLTGDSLLPDLLAVYGHTKTSVTVVIGFLRYALPEQAAGIVTTTKLSFFSEDK